MVVWRLHVCDDVKTWRREEKRREYPDLDPTVTAHLDVLVEHVHPDLPTICRPHVLGEQSAGHASFHVVHSQQYHALIHLRSTKKRVDRQETGDGRQETGEKQTKTERSAQAISQCVYRTQIAPYVVCT